MTFKEKLLQAVQKPKFILVLWILLAVFAGVKQYAKGSYNNYLIFKNVFYHTLHQENLYLEYPELYGDVNHYGPVFSIVIAPFAMLPDVVGIVLWLMANALFLFYAIKTLPIKEEQKILIYWLITNELFTAFVNLQSNPMITAIIILTYCSIREEKEIWAALLITFGTFIKLYPIAGLAFFFFSKHKAKLIAYCALWSLLFFVLPMIISNPEFIVQSYLDWLNELTLKDVKNTALFSYQDFSVMGIYRRATGDPTVSSLYFLVPGIVLFFIPYLNISYYKNEIFQQLLLCSVLIFIVIFSSSSEGSTYIIAFTGVALWFALHERPYSKTIKALMIFAFIFTSLSPTIFPSVLYKELVLKYSLKALPCVLIWGYLIYEMITFKRISQFKHQN